MCQKWKAMEQTSDATSQYIVSFYSMCETKHAFSTQRKNFNHRLIYNGHIATRAPCQVRLSCFRLTLPLLNPSLTHISQKFLTQVRGRYVLQLGGVMSGALYLGGVMTGYTLEEFENGGFTLRAHQMFSVHTTPEESENGGFTLKTNQIFSVYTTPEEFENNMDYKTSLYYP